MKKIILILILLISKLTNAQQIVNIHSGHIYQDMPSGSYIKDIDNVLPKFAGTWVWTNGTDVVIFKLDKVTHFLHPHYGVYEDFMIGNYSYTKNNGSVIIVNTIKQTLNLNPELNPMTTGSPKSSTTIIFTFEDVLITNKRNARAVFEFLPNSLTQMRVTLKNPKESGGRIGDDRPFNPNFTLPIDIILTKQ